MTTIDLSTVFHTPRQQPNPGIATLTTIAHARQDWLDRIDRNDPEEAPARLHAYQALVAAPATELTAHAGAVLDLLPRLSRTQRLHLTMIARRHSPEGRWWTAALQLVDLPR